MGLLKTALIGAAVYGAVKYLTKKDALGQTKLDEIKQQLPQWIEKAKADLNGLGTSNLPQAQ
ncbi:YtxH domain-containing protein [Pedobacter sp. Du54]|uniref:YtxH domain-containing protein n=1 Tax=Pedobacter anseongensis TaxID=3133439 RepID=UPI0030ADD74D